MRNVFTHLLAMFALFALAACGGGGSEAEVEEPGGGGPSNARLSLSTANIDVSMPVTSGVETTSRFTVSVLNDPGTNLYIQVRYSTQGIRDISFSSVNAPLEVVVHFRKPYDLRPGNYQDQLLAELCTDSTCNTIITGSTITVPVHYNVVAPAVAPSMTLSVQSLNLNALITDQQPPGMPALNVAFTGLQASPTVRVTTTGDALASNATFLGDYPDGQSGGRLLAGTKDPGAIGPGVYTGSIQVVACLDANCVNPLAGSPATLPIRITVADHVDGPQGYRIRIVDTTGNDMHWDASRQRLYLASPDPLAQGADQITVVDPATANVVERRSTTWRPMMMAGSDDGQYLYVATIPAAVQRLRLPDLSVDATLALGASASGIEYFARQLSVAPGQPLTVAVARSTNLDTPANGGLVIYDGTTPRAGVLAEQPGLSNAGPFMDRIAWGADTSTMFAENHSSPVRQLYGLNVDGTGAHIARAVNSSGGGLGVRFDDHTLYTNGSELLDPGTLDSLGKFMSPANGRSVSHTVLDVPGNRAYVVWSEILANGGGLVNNLTVFDYASRAQIATVPLHISWNVRKMLRVGNDRVALLVYRSGDTRVVVLDGPLFTP